MCLPWEAAARLAAAASDSATEESGRRDAGLALVGSEPENRPRTENRPVAWIG
jgi:hypothetical protein